ncbi:MAG TPA: class I SAM-dependent methyltransferase [Chloroflexota bacterium]
MADQEYLLHDQYGNSSNLRARILLHERFSVNRRGFFRWFFDGLELPDNARLLEVGCGSGRVWIENAHRIPPEWDITVSDFSEGMLADARRNLLPLRHPFHSAQIDAQRIPYSDGAFDVVIANFMLYHVPNRDRALSEIRRVLTPHGTLYTATNGETNLHELRDVLRRVAPGQIEEEQREFTLENGTAQIARHFARVEIHRYEDALLVTEIEPLMAYIRSWWTGQSLTDTAMAAVHEWAAREIEEHGAVRISKDSGVFEARTGSE